MEAREYLGYSYEQINQVAKFLRLVVPNFKPLVGVICGSGLGALADSLSNKVEIPYEDIPLFLKSTVVGHGGKLVFGKVGDVPVVCMKGRFHAYEGYPLWKVVMPVRVMRLLGAEYLIVTNAAGGIPPTMNVGDIMIIRDHVNFMGMAGQNPLRGPNMEQFGPRFPALNRTYDRGLVKAGLKIAESLGMKDMTHEGVYACVGGPNYETTAELIMMQICGIGSVGMSTAHEVIVAGHCGMKVFAFSLISDKAILDYDSTEIPNHEEVIAAVKAQEPKLQRFTEAMIKHMGSISSGVGSLADSLQDKVEIPYEDIPLFPTSTVVGHGGKLVFGKVGEVPVVCMKGRFHAYEGYPLWKVVMPVRVMRLLGVENLIVTNAAGGINDSFNVGDMMIIKDHVNMMGMSGQNPLRGPNMEEFGPRFPAMNKVYDRGFVKAGRKIADNLGMADITREGVYACVGGPNYETIAELKMLQICGVDSVGMSTAHEVITAAHCGMKVFAFSLISNKAILDYDSQKVPNHEEVVAAAKANENKLKTFTENMIKYIGGQVSLDCRAFGEGRAVPPKAAEGTQAAVQTHLIPGICPAAIIQPCPCVSSPRLAPPLQAPYAVEEVLRGDAGPAGETPQEAPTKRVSIREPGEEEESKEAAEAETIEEVVETDDAPKAGETPLEEPAETVDEVGEAEVEPIDEALKPPVVTEEPTEVATDEVGEAPRETKPDKGAAVGGAPEAQAGEPAEITKEEFKESAKTGGEALVEAEPIDEALEPSVVREEATEMSADEVGEAPQETKPDKDAAVGPEKPQSQDYQSQTVEDRGEQTDSPVEEVEPIQEVGIQIEQSTTANGVAIQTLPESAEAKVGIEEPIVEESAAEDATASVEVSTEAPGEVPTERFSKAPAEAPAEAPTEAAANEKATEEPKEATEEPADEISGEAQKAKPSGDVESPGPPGGDVEPAGEAAPVEKATEEPKEATEEPAAEISGEAEQAKPSRDVEALGPPGEVVEPAGEAAPVEKATEEPKEATEEPAAEISGEAEEAKPSGDVKSLGPPGEVVEPAGEAAPVEKATKEPKEATEEPAAEISGEAKEAKPSRDVEALGPPGEVAEPAGETPEVLKEVVARPPLVCNAAVKVECKSFAKCILREANVGPDTPIEPEVKKQMPDVQQPAKKQECHIELCKKFTVRKKGDRCPSTCPSKK